MYLNEEGVWINTNTGGIQDLFDFNKVKKHIPVYYDYNTKNKSFFNMYLLFKKIGIKNHSEHLQIFNPALIGVDPWDPSLSDAIKIMIDKEISMNPWYFFREFVKIRIGTKKVPFDLNIGNYMAIWLMSRSQDILFIAPRQIGKTFVATTYLAYLINFGGNNIIMSNIHYEEPKAKDNVGKMKQVLDDLPDYLHYHKMEFGKLNPKTGKTEIKRRRVDNSTSMRVLENKLFNNIVKTIVVGLDESKAQTSGRGNTDPIVFVDEMPFIKYNYHLIDTIGQAMSTARKNARMNGLKSGLWLLGTPGFLNTINGKWAYEKIKNDYISLTVNDFHIFDMTVEELEAYRDTRSLNTIFFVNFEFDLLGYDENWLYDKSRKESVEVIKREILLEWLEQSAENPFSRRVLNSIENKSRVCNIKKAHYLNEEFLLYPTKDSIVTKEDDLFEFLKYNCRHGIVIGVDTAYGRGGNNDKSTMVMVDAYNGRIVCTYGSNTINIDDYRIFITTLIKDLKMNNIKAAFAIEINAGGESLISALKKIPQYQDYLVAYPVSEAKLDNPNAIVDTNIIIGNKRIPSDIGLRVTGGKNGSRNKLINTLSILVEKYTECISVPVIAQEINSLTIRKSKTTEGGKIEASDGCHDDYIMAMLHAYYAIFDNSTFLEYRNNIRINLENFLINEDVQILDVTSKSNTRIQTRYIEKNGKLEIIYKDIKTGKIISKDEALAIEKESVFFNRVKEKGINNTEDIYETANMSDAPNIGLLKSLKDNNNKFNKNIEEITIEEFERHQPKTRDFADIYVRNDVIQSQDPYVQQKMMESNVRRNNSGSIFDIFNINR